MIPETVSTLADSLALCSLDQGPLDTWPFLLLTKRIKLARNERTATGGLKLGLSRYQNAGDGRIFAVKEVAHFITDTTLRAVDVCAGQADIYAISLAAIQ